MAPTFKNIKDVYDQTCGVHLHADKNLYKLACQLQEGFINKKREHIEFFGGNLTGVQVVRFTVEDRDKPFTLLLQADEDLLKERVYALRDMHGQLSINQDFKVSSDIFNISMVWLMHFFHHSQELSEEQRLDAKVRICQYLLYKFLTSLLFHYFKFPADKEVAAATYAALSKKFAIKQQGSWNALLLNMATGLMGPESIWKRTIERLDDDYEVVKMLNDMQGRVKDTLKNIYAVFIQVNEHGGRIHSSTSFHEVEGEFELKDNTKSLAIYGAYLKRILTDKPSFMKDELINVVAQMMHTMNPRLLDQSLAWMSDNYKGQHDSLINDVIDLVMEHAIEYLAANREVQRTNVAAVLDKLRGAYMSSRSTDAKLIKARTDVENLVKLATGSRNDNAVASVRTALMLYIVARAYTMRHYANA